MIFLILCQSTIVLGDSSSPIQDSSITISFMISRSLVLYFLSLWFMFMLLTIFESKAIENQSILSSSPSIHDNRPKELEIKPSAPSYASSINTQPLLASSRLNMDHILRPTAPSYMPSIRENPFLPAIDEEEQAEIVIVLRPSQNNRN
jgi:hypothetical protein